jgi:hypothetical protein
MLTRKIVAAAGLLLAHTVSHAEIYKSVSKDGKVSYSNIAPAVKSVSSRGAADPGGRILSPDVIGAVSNVIGMAYLVDSSRVFCGATLPASQKRFTSSAQAWEMRNSSVVAQKDRILSHPVQQLVAEALSAEMARKTAALMQPVRLSSPEERIKWCDQAFADVDRGVLDVVGRPSIAPLMKFGRQ